MQPKLIIHGGAGSIPDKGGLVPVRQSLHSILHTLYPLLLAGATATEIVHRGCRMLEDEPRYNAGTGSVLQSDGQIRMSAAIMDGTKQSFSGVINVSRVKNPIDLALNLQNSPDRVLSDLGSAELARELQIPLHNPLTDQRLLEWIAERQDNFQKTMAQVLSSPNPDTGRGTIGVVALDNQGQLAAGTSTGGKGFEKIGRVSDSAMPAGNYANHIAAVSCTGIGEHIIDECLAAKIVIRTTDGLSLLEAFQKSFTEAQQNNRDFGAIGISATGTIAWGKTSQILIAAFHNGQEIGDTLETSPQTLVFSS